MACSPRTLRTDIWGCGVDKLPGTFLDKECFFVLGPHLQWNCWAGETGTLGGSGQPVRHWRSGHFSVPGLPAGYRQTQRQDSAAFCMAGTGIHSMPLRGTAVLCSLRSS